jgi:hypothetical protein
MVLRTKNNLSKRTGPYFRSQEEANGTDTWCNEIADKAKF